MANENTADYGPLRNLFGTWKGEKGTDVAPDPDGDDYNPYYEVITYERGGDIDNADLQFMAICRYTLTVFKKKNDEIFHEQCGFWLWDKGNETVMHSFTIPRGVAILSGGEFEASKAEDDIVTFNMSAEAGGDWGIVQSPFMLSTAKTTSFKQKLTVSANQLKYQQTTMVDIYGRTFEHTDENTLMKQ